VVQDQVRRNMDMFQRSMRMFLPFPGEAEPASQSADRLARDVAALKSELVRMQEKIDRLTGPDGQERGDGADGPADPGEGSDREGGGGGGGGGGAAG